MTVLENLRRRIDCVRRETPDGWGEVLSLRRYLECAVADRLYMVKPYYDDDDPTEYDELVRSRAEALEVIASKCRP